MLLPDIKMLLPGAFRYVGTIRTHGNLFTQQHPPSRNGDHSSEGVVWLRMWRGNTNMATHPVLSPYTYAL